MKMLKVARGTLFRMTHEVWTYHPNDDFAFHVSREPWEYIVCRPGDTLMFLGETKKVPRWELDRSDTQRRLALLCWNMTAQVKLFYPSQWFNDEYVEILYDPKTPITPGCEET